MTALRVPGASDSPSPAPSNEGAGAISGALLRKVAHDIVGPAGVASGALKELERSLGDERATQVSMLSLAYRSLLRLERLAKRLRLTAMLRDGGLELETEPIPLDAIVAAAVASASNLDGRKNIAIEGPATLEGVQVMGDKEHLGLILSELVSNSLRFARKSVRLGAKREGGVVVLTFEDDGPGYPADLMTRGTSSLAPEAGLALPIVAAIASRFGGHLELGVSALTSKDGKPGALARIELPVSG